MKLIMAVISKDDTKTVVSELIKGGFAVTKLSSTGGFLRGGTTTIMIGTHSERVSYAIEILRKTCRGRKYDISHANREMRQFAADNQAFMEDKQVVVVGGATVFVLNIEETHKI